MGLATIPGNSVSYHGKGIADENQSKIHLEKRSRSHSPWRHMDIIPMSHASTPSPRPDSRPIPPWFDLPWYPFTAQGVSSGQWLQWTHFPMSLSEMCNNIEVGKKFIYLMRFWVMSVDVGLSSFAGDCWVYQQGLQSIVRRKGLKTKDIANENQFNPLRLSLLSVSLSLCLCLSLFFYNSAEQMCLHLHDLIDTPKKAFQSKRRADSVFVNIPIPTFTNTQRPSFHFFSCKEDSGCIKMVLEATMVV